MKNLYRFCIALVFFVLSAGAANAQVVASGSCGTNLTWTLTGTSPNYTLTISGTGAMTDYDTGFPPWYLYQGTGNISTLVIGNGVTSIGNSAFLNYSGLTGTLTIPNSVTTIGNRAFSSCSGLTGTLTIGNSVSTIGEGAFAGCSGFIGTLTIGNSVTTIGNSAFGGCSGLTGTLTIPNSVTSIGNHAFQYCSGLTGTLTIPNSVTSIEMSAFKGCCGLTGTLTIPNSVTSIENGVFWDCSGLTSVTIPNSVTTIGNSAFSGCSGFTGTLTIPNSVTSIGGSAFSGCSGLTGTLTIPNSVTSIGGYAFYGCSGLTSVTIGNSVASIGSGAFENCSGLTGTLTIPNSVTSIENGVFWDCSGLTSVTIPNSVTTIREYAFSGCSGLTGTLTIPNSVTSIEMSAFENCSGLTGTLTIPNSVTSIEYGTFKGCSGLTSVIIPNSVTTIRIDVFDGCTGLDTIRCNALLPPVIYSITFSGVDNNIPLIVPCESVTAYRNHQYWGRFNNIMCENDNTAKISLHWDYSYPQPNIQPKGVAADGVARLLVCVKDSINTVGEQGRTIQKVSASLSDDIYSNHFPNLTNYLGKLCKATITDRYSDEANSANTTVVNNIEPNENGEVWLWYVAPEDFLEVPVPANPTYEESSERIININIEIHYNDNSIENKTLSVEVVRPPLMLAHGINSSEHCWDNFHYDIGYFKNSPLFKQVKAINLLSGGSFNTNAYLLVNDVDNSFLYNVYSFRNKGYASNQVDYVCHSMGGCVLRKAIENMESGYIDYSEYHYGKGFVHKAITINTPHNGSPVANLVFDYRHELSGAVVVGTSIPFSRYFMPELGGFFDYNGQLTEAVKDLQMGNNGVRFGVTNVKNHNIAGDINMYNFPTIEIPSYIKLLNFMWAEITRQGVNSTIEGAFNFFNNYFQQKGVDNFFGDGDGVVSLSSQLAQTEGQINDSHNYNTVFSSGLDVLHTSIVDKVDVGMLVKDLLNTSIHSNKFKNTIDANNNPVVYSPARKSAANDLKTVVKVFDNSRIEIISPNNNDFGINDSIYLTFQIKDTNNLMFVDYLFQDNYGISLSKNEMQTVGFGVSPDFLDKQTIYVIANYDMGNTTMCYIDTVSLKVVTNENLTDFNVNPKTANIYTTQYYYPQMQATYEGFVSNVPCHSNKLTIDVNDTSIVRYDQNYYCFVGKEEGNTFAVITYDNLQDTICFNVMLLPESDTVPNGIEEIEMPKLPSNSELSINIYPNPAKNYVTVVFDYSIKGTMALYDILGKNILSEEISGDRAIINMSNLSTGMYILRVVTNDRIVGRQKIIKK